MKKYSLLLWFTAISLFCSAQDLTFKQTEHDFLKIRETGGNITHRFTYENRSKSNISIIMIENSNRSVAVNFSRDTIHPKIGKGSIDVTLSPYNLPGVFNHTIYVKTIENGVNQNYALTIKADIEPRQRPKEEIYGMREGNLRYKTNSLRYENLTATSVIVDTFFIYNVDSNVMTFTYKNLPNAFKILSMPEKLAPQEEGKIVFEYSAAVKNDWGNVWDRVTIITNDLDRPGKTLYVTGTIYDDFASLTPQQKANAPIVVVDNVEYSFGTATEGDEITHDFKISNTGKSTLYIRKLKASCGCTAATPDKTELAPGESTITKVVFRTHGKKGRQASTVDLITNDPTQPKITLKVTGMLNPKPTQPTN